MGRIAPQSVEEYVASLPAEEQELAHHVLLGDINEKSGRPVGFHHAPNGVPPPGRRIDEILEHYPDGSYRAVVSFYHPRGQWVRKEGEHTMFPDHWTRDQVMAAGCEAYRMRVNRVVRKWKGRGCGIPVSGWRRNNGGGPATFYPDHKR